MSKSRLITTMMAGGLSLVLAMPVSATDNEPAKILFKRMSDYLVSQNKIAFSYDSNLEVVTADLQKLSFSSSGTVTLNRPDKLRTTRTGGFADLELVYDGQILSAMAKYRNIHAELASKGTIDELIQTLRFEYGLQIPAADFLSTSPYEVLMANVTNVKDLGSGYIGGRECDHLAFRTDEADWELWISQSETSPYPCRFKITSKMMAQAPSFTIEVKEWKSGEAVPSDAFRLDVADARKVEFNELPALDEVPTELVKGAQQ